MGLMDFVKNQLVDVIEFTNDGNKFIVYKYDRPDNEIKQGAKVIVREAQVAVFVKGGQIADILMPGTHTLNTDNLPILSTLKAFSYGFNSPIKSDLYFVSQKQFLENKWATKNPLMRRDKEFNMVRIRAYGKYAFRIVDVCKFMKEIFGVQQKMLTFDIMEYLESWVIEQFSVSIGNSDTPIIDIISNYKKIAAEIAEELNNRAIAVGIEFTDVIVENISLPEEVEKMIDEQSGIGMAEKDMSTFMQYQTARAMRDASKQEGGLAGLGAGMAMGKAMAKTVENTMEEQPKESEIRNNIQMLREYKQLLDEGILTQEEFDAKKKELL